MKHTAHIIYTHYMDRKGINISVGGIQTYITELSKVLLELGFDVVVYQAADLNFETNINEVIIRGYAYTIKEAEKMLVKRCKEYIKDCDIVIFGTDILTSKVDVPSIAIQHGVSWDVPDRSGSYLYKYLKKCYKAWKRIKTNEAADCLVCVDYNYINWVRAVSPFCKSKMIAIPNFTQIPNGQRENFNNEKVNIIFARRFYWYRGTRIFVEAIERILSSKKNVYVTIAGEGDDEALLLDRLSKYDNVKFIKYSSEESLKIHENIDIAIVPTVGSEGTSLSLLEAMASKCAVICTNVGGMTNIVLDRYNGLMISPESEELEAALIELIDDAKLRNELAEKAIETVNNSFSYEKWRESWKKVIMELDVGVNRCIK